MLKELRGGHLEQAAGTHLTKLSESIYSTDFEYTWLFDFFDFKPKSI